MGATELGFWAGVENVKIDLWIFFLMVYMAELRLAA